MSVLPSDINYIENINISTNTDLPMFKEYAWDFDNDGFIIQDGELVVLQGNEALRVWIYKTLKTQKYRYLAYSFYYGNEFEQLINKGYDKELVSIELKKFVEKCLLVNEYITSIDSVDLELEDEKLIGTINLTTVYSSMETEVDVDV